MTKQAWQITGHTDREIEVLFDDGSRLNYNVETLVYPPEPPPIPVGVPKATPVSTRYDFAVNDILAEHAHAAAQIHDICVLSGRVMVRRAVSGDVEAVAGDVVQISVGEAHSVEAIEPSITLHTRAIQARP